MKRIQETVSDEAKAKLVAHAEKHNLTQGEALDAILRKVEV